LGIGNGTTAHHGRTGDQGPSSPLGVAARQPRAYRARGISQRDQPFKSGPRTSVRAGGAAVSKSGQLSIPNSTAFAGAVLRNQVLQIELDAVFSITAITSSNALTLTVGTL
jgi:hypothetical protein